MNMITERFKFVDIFPDKAASVAQRLHIKKDEIPFVRKYYTAEKDKTEIKKKERAVVSYISTSIKDRDGEKLVPEGVILENYQKNPIVPFGHDYKTIPPAKNMWIKRDEKGLIAKTVFAKNQRAEEYYQAYTEDIGGTGPLLNAFSVGFIPLEWKDADQKDLEKDPDLPKRIYNKWELLEYSLVPIPSCAEALTIAVEKELFSKKLLKELEIEVVKDVEDKEIEIELEPIETVTHPIGKVDEMPETISGEIEVEIEVDKVKGIKAGWVEEKEAKVKDAEKKLTEKYGVDIEIIKDGEIVTKPETTEKYHHIPVNPGCEITATITISAAKGIKATYCGDVKKVHTYLFDVKKWTMAEAKKWVEDHKGLNESIHKHFTEGIEPEEEEHKEIIRTIVAEAEISYDSEEKEVLEESEALRGDITDKLDEVKGKDRESQQSGNDSDFYIKTIECIRNNYDMLLKEKEKIVTELKDHIADLKAGRVLSRKNRNIMKTAHEALGEVLKADAIGTQEDEESESGGTVTERTVELLKDGEREFSIKDVEELLAKAPIEVPQDIIESAFKKTMDPEKVKKHIEDGIRLALQKYRGKVE